MGGGGGVRLSTKRYLKAAHIGKVRRGHLIKQHSKGALNRIITVGIRLILMLILTLMPMSGPFSRGDSAVLLLPMLTSLVKARL